MDIDRQAAFYLGREWDPQTGQALPDRPLMYDARDLTTHAVCIGMTGSGKTGLGVDLLEEATLDGIPSIIIDPKGDMTNLLLAFPDLAPSDFEPWVNVDDARRKGETVPEHARTMASVWQKGLAEWGQDAERVRRFRESAEFAIYTPGSDAGLPVSVLQSLRAPELDWEEEGEIGREMIASTVSALLGLVGVDADPVQSRDHILLSHIFEYAWRRGENLDLAALIAAIQRPPVRTLGVFDVDTFYPEKERFQLAMALNRVAASPSFANWIEGVPLDIQSLLHTADGRPRVNIFYIAHLNDAERVFFVTLLLQQVLGWMRRLSGTTSLRCLLYLDELFGFFPPYPANPSSKMPLLTLLKQARAFGLGCVLTTQNPMDLDYKGLTNAGTWFIGKLQTDRDKARVLEGMEGVTSEVGTLLDRDYLDRMISSLGSRVFILHNVHSERPLLFQTRWALSYLRGPLTRNQVRDLMKPLKAGIHAAIAQPVAAAQPATSGNRSAAPMPAGYTPTPPRVNARVPQFFLPITEERAATPREAHLVYVPHVVGLASVVYGSPDRGQALVQKVAVVAPVPEPYMPVDWWRYRVTDLPSERLLGQPGGEGAFTPLPAGMTDSPPYTRLRDDLVETVFRRHRLTTFALPALKLQAQPGEDERAFQQRCQEQARAARDAEVAQTEARFARELEKLQTRLAREKQELEDDRIEHGGRKQEELLSAGESLAGFLLGGRRSRALSQASRKRRMTQQARSDVLESETAIVKLEAQIADLQADQGRAVQEIRDRWADAALQIEKVELAPKKSDVRLEAFGLLWVPYWWSPEVGATNAPGEKVPAYPLAWEPS
ncbi:MAG: ATP-binding protein [Anaerolineae bacterium]